MRELGDEGSVLSSPVPPWLYASPFTGFCEGYFCAPRAGSLLRATCTTIHGDSDDKGGEAWE